MTSGPLLVIDTATTRAVIALSAPSPDGGVTHVDTWPAGYRHGEELLARIDGLLTEAGVPPSSLGGIIVGTGPGAFTGLRVGLATAKGLAHALGVPIVGVATASALLHAAADLDPSLTAAATVLILPAGPSDRVACREGAPGVIVPGGQDPELRPGDRLIAVDLAGRAPDDAVALGERTRVGLDAALLALGGSRLIAGDADDLARLEPEYVTLPRGVARPVGDDAVVMTAGGSASGSMRRSVAREERAP